MNTSHTLSTAFFPAALLCALSSLSPDAQAAEPAARSDATATTRLHITTDWGQGELIQHLGTSYGTGYVGGRSASVTTFHMQRLCRLPCDVDVATEGNYYVDAPGMLARQIAIPAGALQLDAKVHGASQAPLTLSLVAVYIGGIAAIAGGVAWAAGVADPTTETKYIGGSGANAQWGPVTTPSKYETLVPAVTIAGSGVLVAGIAGLIFFPRTHVEASDGGRLDARARPSQKGIGVSPQGFTV